MTTTPIDTSTFQQQQQHQPLLLTPSTLAAMIDHTFLKPHGGPDDIVRLCREANEYGFAVVCVNPAQVELARRHCPRVGAAIGFPLGQNTTACKVFETQDAIRRGACEIDVVLNLHDLSSSSQSRPISGDDRVREEIELIVNVCKPHNVLCKVILETCFLVRQDKVRACEICKAAGADFVKTSTGFGIGGATVEDVRLLRDTVGHHMGVKASGGIRTLEQARAMIQAGANRIGTSNGVAIVEELKREFQQKPPAQDYYIAM